MWLRIILCTIALLQVSECLVNPCKKGLKTTQFFAHPEAADKYIQCSMFGQMFVFSCPPGLVWKHEKTACDLKSFVSIFSIPSTTTPSSNIDSGSAPSARIVAAPVVPQVTTPQVVPQTVPQQVQQQTFEQPPMQPQVQQPKQVQQQPQQQQFQQPQQVQQPMQVQQQQQQQFQQPQQVQQPMQVQQQQQQQFQQPQQVQQQAPQQPQQFQQQEFRSQQQEIQQLQQQLQQEQQQLQQQPMPTTGPSSTQFAPIATIVSSTTSTTTTTTTPVPVPLPTANQPIVTPVGNTVVSTQSVSGGRCGSVSVSGSVFNIVNGVYSKLPSSASIYRRSDNLQLPGLLVKTSDQQWCVTFSFSTVDFNTLTVPDVLSRCGAGLDCCMLISEPASTATAGIAEIDDPSAVWIANILENRGKQDASIKFTCETTVKACTKVPFCPPECQGTRDGCDICECNGVPFFKIQSSELSSFGGAQQQQQTPVVQQQTPQIPQQIPQQVPQQVQQQVQQQVPQQVQQQIPQQIPQQVQQQVQQQVPQQVQQQVQQQVKQQIPQQVQQQQPQMQPQPSTRPNPVVAPSTMQPTTQPQRPVTKVVQPATMQPQIIQEEQFRPTFIQNPHQEQQQQQQLQLQQQELQTLNELDKTVHQAQSPATQANSVRQFANRVEAIEKQQLQNQVDQLNRLIASAKTPSPPVTRPMFPGQQPDVNAQQSQKIVQSFSQPQPQQPLTDMNHFVNTIPVRQPTQQQQQQQQTMQSGLTERQRQELLMQQRKQQDIIARQQQEQLVRQEQEQRMLQQQFKQLQQQKTPGITTLSSRKFAARLPQPMAHMNQIKVLALSASNNQSEIQPTQPIHFEQQQQNPVQPVPTPVVEASVAQPAPAVQPQQVPPQQQQQQHPTIQPIQPTQQLIQPFQPIQQQPPQQPQQQVHTPIKPVMTVDQTAPTTTRMNSGIFVDQQRQSPSSKQFNSPSLNKAIEFNRQNMHKTLFQPMIKSIPITKCNAVQCAKNMVCREIRDCPMCSPMCLPQDPTDINLGHVITCDNIKCPVPFKCVKSTFDQSIKCEV